MAIADKSLDMIQAWGEAFLPRRVRSGGSPGDGVPCRCDAMVNHGSSGESPVDRLDRFVVELARGLCRWAMPSCISVLGSLF